MTLFLQGCHNEFLRVHGTFSFTIIKLNLLFCNYNPCMYISKDFMLASVFPSKCYKNKVLTNEMRFSLLVFEIHVKRLSNTSSIKVLARIHLHFDSKYVSLLNWENVFIIHVSFISFNFDGNVPENLLLSRP